MGITYFQLSTEQFSRDEPYPSQCIFYPCNGKGTLPGKNNMVRDGTATSIWRYFVDNFPMLKTNRNHLLNTNMCYSYHLKTYPNLKNNSIPINLQQVDFHHGVYDYQHLFLVHIILSSLLIKLEEDISPLKENTDAIRYHKSM